MIYSLPGQSHFSGLEGRIITHEIFFALSLSVCAAGFKFEDEWPFPFGHSDNGAAIS